jgi:UDP-N-acetylmuramate--alanine ligase
MVDGLMVVRGRHVEELKKDGQPVHYHLVGIAGVGMSALAQVLLAEGFKVSGSDRDNDKGKDLAVLGKLGAAGIRLVPQDGTGVVVGTSGVVVSTAIEADNPDVLAAQRLNVPLIHRAEMLASLLKGKECVAITGTSGKSTVTGMVGWILDRLGADPVVVNGAIVLNWCDAHAVGNVRLRKGEGAADGKRDLWVVEVDESDRSLLKFHPDWAAITNVSKDHFEIEETTDLFRQFSTQVGKGLVSCLDSPGLLDGFRPELSGSGSSFVRGGVKFSVSLPGLHNAENALFAVALCERLGFSTEDVAGALDSFRGIHRRLETVGMECGVTVVDDYGHNPAKIEAAWRALAPHFSAVLAVWQPHGFGPLSMMLEEVAAVFSEVCGTSDRIYILPVYDAGGTADRTIRSEALVDILCSRGKRAALVDKKNLGSVISGEAQRGDVVLVMGARDPELPALAEGVRRTLAF